MGEYLCRNLILLSLLTISIFHTETTATTLQPRNAASTNPKESVTVLHHRNVASRNAREVVDDEYYDDSNDYMRLHGDDPTLPTDFNICDLKGSHAIYCYCNVIDPNEVRIESGWMFHIMHGFFAVGQFAVKKMLVLVRLGQIRLGLVRIG